MAQRDVLKRCLDAGMAFTATTRSRAEAIVRELVRTGEIQRDQFQGQVDELIERSRRNGDHLVALVRKEVISPVAEFGTALWDELRVLEKSLSGSGAAAAGGEAARDDPPNPAGTDGAPAAEAADPSSDAS